MHTKIDKLTILKIIDKINSPIKELYFLSNNPIGREQAIEELVFLRTEINKMLKD